MHQAGEGHTGHKLSGCRPSTRQPCRRPSSWCSARALTTYTSAIVPRNIIPVSHGHATHEQMPNSRLEVFPRSGHFPQLDEPKRFLDVLVEFIDSTQPATRERTV